MPEPAVDFQIQADMALDASLLGLTPEDSAIALAVLGNRAATRLHNLAKERAAATRGESEWASWAALQNASRNVVLQASTCRDLAARLAGRRR